MVAIGKQDAFGDLEGGDRQEFGQEDGKLSIEGDQSASFRADHAHDSPNMCSAGYTG